MGRSDTHTLWEVRVHLEKLWTPPIHQFYYWVLSQQGWVGGEGETGDQVSVGEPGPEICVCVCLYTTYFCHFLDSPPGETERHGSISPTPHLSNNDSLIYQPITPELYLNEPIRACDSVTARST